MKFDVSIGIGEYYADRKGTLIYTLLGSCVAVCLFDPENRIGGMNHILLPGEPDMGAHNASARYGVHAMELLINAIMALGGNRTRLIAKAFGGANVISSIPEGRAMGKKNIDFTVDFLHTEKIEMVSRDFGGHSARKVYFDTATGDVFLKRIATMKTLAETERRQYKQMKETLDKPGEITLFTH